MESRCISPIPDNKRCQLPRMDGVKYCELHFPDVHSSYTLYKQIQNHHERIYNHEEILLCKKRKTIVAYYNHIKSEYDMRVSHTHKFVHIECRDFGHAKHMKELETKLSQVEYYMVHLKTKLTDTREICENGIYRRLSVLKMSTSERKLLFILAVNTILQYIEGQLPFLYDFTTEQLYKVYVMTLFDRNQSRILIDSIPSTLFRRNSHLLHT